MSDYEGYCLTFDEEVGAKLNAHGVGVDMGGLPLVCRRCQHHHESEFGDYGALLWQGGCALAIIPPTRRGVCARWKPYGRREGAR